MPKKLLLLFLTLLILVPTGLIVSKNNWFKPESFKQNKAYSELSSKDYEKIRDKYVNLLIQQDPRIALEQLREDVKNDNLLSRSCHILTHELGRESYKKYQDFAQSMKYQDEICNSGYMHGIIEEYFSTSKDIFASLKNVCSQYRAESFIGWECFHGVGHGVMYYTSNNLPKSVELCESFKDKSKILFCVNGVFMENFATDQKLHPSRFLKMDDPFYPCFEQKQEHKADCYVYAPTYFLALNRNAYAKALSWCKGAEEKYKYICESGVGSQLIKENINNPLFAQKVCMSSDNDQIIPCIEGMVNLYINHFGSLEPAKKLCNQLEAQNKKICEGVIQLRSAMFK